MENKISRLDIVATLDDSTKINIEMQIDNNLNTIERSIFHLTGLSHQNLYKGEDYVELPRVITIWILGYDLFNDGPFHETIKLTRDFNHLTLTEKLEIHYIQIPKFQKENNYSSKLAQWLTFIINDNLEVIKMSDDKLIQKAEKELETLNSDENEKRLAQMREDSRIDKLWALSAMKKHGLEEGRKEGLKEGHEKGIKEGKKEGIKEEKIKIAKKNATRKI